MNDLFWLNEPSILLRKDKLTEIWPYSHMSFNKKMNATTRFVLYVSIIGFAVLNNYLILMFGIVLILLLLFLYNTNKNSDFEAFNEDQLFEEARKGSFPVIDREGNVSSLLTSAEFMNNPNTSYPTKNLFEAESQVVGKESIKSSPKNPLYNVLVTDYEDNVDKPALKSNYDENQEEIINNHVKNFVLENNKDNKDIGKIFQNVVNNMEFETSMRQFHMNPSTTIPNDQKDFFKFCYRDLYSEKPLTVY